VLVGAQQDVEAYSADARGTGVVVAGCHIVDAGSALAVPAVVGVPTTTSLETLADLVAEVGADTVVVLPGRAVDTDVVRRLAWALEDSSVTVGVITPVSSVSPHRVRTTRLGDRAVVELAPVGASALEERVKGLIDRFVAALLVLAVAPLLLALIVAVRLDSRGGGLFVQTRVGRHGKTFRMYKLRTMFVDAESMKQALLEDNESDGVLFKIRRDPRVTRVGYWLRRSSLDELPQLLNVLRGDMSLVGPRPALPSEVAAYDDVARRRLVVKPGITGLWQVSGRADLLWEESLRLDIYYTENWRLLDDLGIAARTVGAVTLARGAY
jgi:exopolysaccharide biosynthesis polyprenyl glycosylphosphotransferase